MKKTLLSLIALFITTIAFAQTEIDGICYNLNNENKTAEVTSGSNEYSGNIIIPEKITYNSTEYSVTSIGDYAFSSCSSLTSISIPNSVTSIGKGAFYNCSSLEKAIIGVGVATIGSYAFNDCQSLTTLEWNAKSCGDFGLSVFEYTNITSVTFGDSVQHIPAYLFPYNNNLTTITIGSNIKSIGENAFGNYPPVSTININIKSIEDYCKNSIVNRLLADQCEIYCSRHIMLNGEEVTNVVFPQSITAVNDYVFYRCKSITSIEIPNGVTSIGASAFNGTAITSIEIPNSVTSIGASAFGGTAITSIEIPNSVTEIGYYALNACKSLVSARLPEGIVELDTGLFHHCYALESVNIPNSVTKIKHAAFLCCWSLKNITIPSGVTKIENMAFVDCESLTSLTIPSSVTDIECNSFSQCDALPQINVEEGNPNYIELDGVLYTRDTTILHTCPAGKESISIPNCVTTIWDYALYSCDKITSVTIPSSVTYVKRYALCYLNSLDTIICLNATPPSAEYLGAEYEIWKLFVPKGSLNAYRAHEEWGKFVNIYELKGEDFTITTVVNDESAGVVNGAGVYEEGTEVTLTAIPNEDYRFVQWSDGNTDNPRVVTMTENKTYTAIFAVKEFALYATSASPTMGYVRHTIEAVAIEGFEFDRWSDDNTDNPRTVILTEDTKLYAYFKMSSGENPVNLETSKISSANIYTTNSTLHIEGATENYHILDAAGRLIYSGNATTLQLPRGIYLITMGGEVEKIVL